MDEGSRKDIRSINPLDYFYCSEEDYSDDDWNEEWDSDDDDWCRDIVLPETRRVSDEEWDLDDDDWCRDIVLPEAKRRRVSDQEGDALSLSCTRERCRDVGRTWSTRHVTRPDYSSVALRHK